MTKTYGKGRAMGEGGLAEEGWVRGGATVEGGSEREGSSPWMLGAAWCVVVASGCGAGAVSCERDSDCTAPGVCDSKSKVCDSPADGGQGDGGAETACSSGCAAWQTCKPEN